MELGNARITLYRFAGKSDMKELPQSQFAPHVPDRDIKVGGVRAEANPV